MNGDKIKIAVLAGTTRQQRKSIRAAKYVAEFGSKMPGVEIIFVDPADFNFAGDGNDPEGKDPRYSKITAEADGFFAVVPEYNHSFPGSLKRMLDSELKNYNHKPIAIAGVSKGSWGGVRAVESLVPSVREMGLVVTSISSYFPNVQDNFGEDNQPVDEIKDKIDASLKKTFDELIWMTKTLKAARES